MIRFTAAHEHVQLLPTTDSVRYEVGFAANQNCRSASLDSDLPWNYVDMDDTLYTAYTCTRHVRGADAGTHAVRIVYRGLSCDALDDESYEELCSAHER